MLENELLSLIDEVAGSRHESETLEIKSAHEGCPRVYETLSSFSNSRRGGTILFGIREDEGFLLEGVYDPQDLLHRLSAQAEEMEPPVVPCFSFAQKDGKSFLAMEIPPLDMDRKPCFHKAKGMLKGSYNRVGDKDVHMSEAEIRDLESYRRRARYDLRETAHPFDCLDQSLIKAYLEKLKDGRPNIKDIEDKRLLGLMGMLINGNPTLSGVLLFSVYPQAYFPRLTVNCIRVNGKSIVSGGNIGEERFVDSKSIGGRLDQMLDEAVSFVNKNMSHSMKIDSSGKRVDIYEYPLNAVREAVLNALIHRDYSPYSEGIPIKLEMYEDRMEITNPGMIYGPIEVEDLGRLYCESRNKTLVGAGELLGISENRYSGIPIILDSCQKAGLPKPSFVNKNGYFKLIFYNARHKEVSKKEREVIDFCSEAKTRNEISSFLSKSPYYVYKKVIEPLLEEGYLEYVDQNLPVRGNKLISVRDV